MSMLMLRFGMGSNHHWAMKTPIITAVMHMTTKKALVKPHHHHWHDQQPCITCTLHLPAAYDQAPVHMASVIHSQLD